jgi:acetyl-CoA synthetase
MTVAELETLVNRVASSLTERGFRPGDAIAIVSPMTVESVAIYLGILKAGCVVVSIPDSFRPKEIATRLRLSDAKAVFTQDVIIRGGKEHTLYENVIAAGAPGVVVVPTREALSVVLRADDQAWRDFLGECDQFDAVEREPSDPINILFSSGTTGDPKAIPWTQTTPIKCAMDAHFHQNIHAGDVLVWPTNLGWMMGPWLIFASLINRATIGLFNGTPNGAEFGRFVQDARVTMLGVVPSLVKTWRAARCMEGLDWSHIQAFSLTGECSNADDMSYLMSLAGGRPVIEYCGGTEIGGAYITGTVTLPCIPAAFNTPALGLDILILDEDGTPADNGEVFIVPPSIGLSEKLLHQDHREVYYAGTPRGPRGELLRRHGDQIERLKSGCYRAHGRVDDTMNLGGIKVSSAEIERVVRTAADVQDVAAVAVPPPGGGPSQLVIFAVPAHGDGASREYLQAAMQQGLRRELNPLFKIHEVVLIDSLPRTASNKVMRRVLRERMPTI